MQINQERVDKLLKWVKFLSPFYVKSICITGEDNLSKLGDKKAVYLPNHLSYLDFILISKVLNDNQLMQPATIAGNNLDRRPTNKWLNQETGFYFVDRLILEKGEKEEKARELLKKRKSIEEITKEDENLMVFIEGGFRKFDGEVMKDVEIGYPRDYLIEANKQGKNLENYFGVNIAIKYYPYPIEQPFIEKSRKFKQKMLEAETEKKETKYMKKYYLTDLKAYLRQIGKIKKPIAKIDIGEPYPLNQFLGYKKQEEWKNFICADIKKRYAKL